MNLSLDSGFHRNLVKQYCKDSSVLGGSFGMLLLYMTSRLQQANLRERVSKQASERASVSE